MAPFPLHAPTPPPPSPTFNRSGQPTRKAAIPRPFVDELPSVQTSATEPHGAHIVKRVILHVREYFRTGLNQFNILREYVKQRPSYDPDAQVRAEDLANFPAYAGSTDGANEAMDPPPPPWPFENMSKYLLMNWFHTGSTQKSEAEVTRLATEVILAPNFQSKDLLGFNAHRENKRLDNATATAGEPQTPFSTDDWQEVSVRIEVPIALKNHIPQAFHVPGLHHRSIVRVIKATWKSAISSQFHLTPFRKIHVDPMGNETRIYDEVYTSDAWEAAHDELQKQPSEPGCKLEKVIAGLMFWSDSTHLAQFGTASVWPLYLYFANLSKYTRAEPNSGACHHVAYIPTVSTCSSPSHKSISLASFLDSRHLSRLPLLSSYKAQPPG